MLAGEHVNGNVGHKYNDDKQSTLSRYWTLERSASVDRKASSLHQVKRVCRESKCLFEDADFPAASSSLGSRKSKKLSFHSQNALQWLRPHELCQRPTFVSNENTKKSNETRLLEVEGGDPWLTSALASLSLTPVLLDRVVPQDQNFEQGYFGVFRFRFWKFGEWTEVLVDDRLPTHKGRLLFMRSSDPTQFWPALIEKAYAKLYGSYEALSEGFTTRALQDVTGGIVQSFSLGSQDRLLTFQVLNSAVPRSTLLMASINLNQQSTMVAELQGKRQPLSQLRLRNGLVTNHAYSVTGLARVRGPQGDTHLVRLRNPWGRGEWNGAWSERSWEWDSLSQRDKELLGQRVKHDGEFWMSFEDMASQFSLLDLVHVGPDDWMSEKTLHGKKPWRAVLARRRWRAGYNAGGSPAHIETTAMNPQFHVQIPRHSGHTISKCHVVVSVTQQYETSISNSSSSSMSSSKLNLFESASERRQRRRRKRKKLHHIGFAVYEVPPHMSRLTPLYVAEHPPLDVTNHSVAREVVTFFTLPPGDYIVVPQTNVPNCDAKFLLRILTDEHSNIWEVNEDNMVFRNPLHSLDFDQQEALHLTGLLKRLTLRFPSEVDAVTLQKILKSGSIVSWKHFLLERPSLELCRSLLMLRDFNISGKIALVDVPLLLHLLHFWKMAFVKFVGANAGCRTSSFNLRPILWEAGVTVSNKVLECLVLRFANKHRSVLLSEHYFTIMVRLHLAHERYHSIDTKTRENPLSLEEMILMTIYS